MDNYQPYGEEWQKEMMKLPKTYLIDMIRKAQTGTADLKLLKIETYKDAQVSVEGILNDLSDNLITKEDAMAMLGEYTARIMHVFYENAKKLFNEKPELLI